MKTTIFVVIAIITLAVGIAAAPVHAAAPSRAPDKDACTGSSQSCTTTHLTGSGTSAIIQTRTLPKP